MLRSEAVVKRCVAYVRRWRTTLARQSYAWRIIATAVEKEEDRKNLQCITNVLIYKSINPGITRHENRSRTYALCMSGDFMDQPRPEPQAPATGETPHHSSPSKRVNPLKPFASNLSSIRHREEPDITPSIYPTSESRSKHLRSRTSPSNLSCRRNLFSSIFISDMSSIRYSLNLSGGTDEALHPGDPSLPRDPPRRSMD